MIKFPAIHNRASYHSDLKLSVKLGILPKDIQNSIPRSSLHRFKNADYSGLIGLEYSYVLENLELLKEIARSRAALKTATTVLRIASFMKSIRVFPGQATSIKIPELKERLARFVDKMADRIPRVQILKLFGLSQDRFRIWAKGIKICPSSPLDRCRKSCPHQLSRSELQIIARAFRKSETSHWPASSIAWKLINEKKIYAHISTITGYAKRLGLLHRKHFHKSRKTGSISTTEPNKAWHLDATIIHTESHEKAYLQFILDNYSRKIIAWIASFSISGLQTTALLKEAFAPLADSSPDSIDLFVDGGSENNNSHVSAFIKHTSINKLVARIDVTFSNSMIEAVNKILKYQYLFKKPIPDKEHLQEAIRSAIDDYNSRPHYALKGVTPNDAYAGKVFNRDEYQERIHAARFARITENRKSCDPCLPFTIEEVAE